MPYLTMLVHMVADVAEHLSVWMPNFLQGQGLGRWSGSRVRVRVKVRVGVRVGVQPLLMQLCQWQAQGDSICGRLAETPMSS